MISSKRYLTKIFLVSLTAFIFCAVSIDSVFAAVNSPYREPTLPAWGDDVPTGTIGSNPLLDGDGSAPNLSSPDPLPQFYEPNTSPSPTPTPTPVDTTPAPISAGATNVASAPITLGPVAASTLGGFINYGGTVLKAFPCLNGTIISVGSPKPAIVMIAGTSMRKLYYMEKVPGHKVLGNAVPGGFCEIFNFLGFKIRFPVPATAYYIGSNLIAFAGAKAEAEAPKALPAEDATQTTDPLNSGIDTTNPSLGVGTDAKSAGMAAFNQYKGQIENQQYIGVMDYSKSSSEARFSIIDTSNGQTVYSFNAAHGYGSDPTGSGFATQFSDVSGSHMSELGAFKATPYYSPGMKTNVLLLNGLEPGNINAASRYIEIHPADYVTSSSCGMSGGCIAYPTGYQNIVNNLLKNGFIYNYYKK